MTVTKPIPAAPDVLIDVPAWRLLRSARDPMAAIDAIGRETNGALARLHLGPARPYLVTHPAHVEHVYRNADRYRREGMLWKPVRRLVGTGIAGEGERWRTSRRILQPLFTLRHTRSMSDAMAAAVGEAVELLARRVADGRPVDVLTEMTRITHRVLIRVFFGNRIREDDADRLSTAIDAAFVALGWRIALPWVGHAMPVPGDRAFAKAVRIADEVIYPLIRTARPDDDDLVAHLVAARDEHGEPLEEARIRDDLVGMVVAGTEVTALTLTWVWVLLDAHPEVFARLSEEAAAVVGGGDPRPEHLPRLEQTRMVLRETLRLYPVGWVLPRLLTADDTLGGVPIRAGSTIMLSPYLTHRLPGVWPDPLTFDPQRFAGQELPRFGYLPFSAGPHSCLGEHFGHAQAQLAVAAVLARFRPELVGPRSLRPRATASLRPWHRARMVLRPRG
ncbi:cytochrome P450 [Dactylosporangium sp. CA-092794]|uniref:cytochrome P450 n=1 Tax=Dactylosporangium sp. CA-092794 TaxID=3239929 RepID=UPI003D915DC1